MVVNIEGLRKKDQSKPINPKNLKKN